MRRALWIAMVICAASGCYTVLRHPRLEDETEPAEDTSYDVGLRPADDCRTCHASFDPWPLAAPVPVAWDAYARAPWWTRSGVGRRVQGGALVNDRPPLPVPVALPPANIAPPAAATTVPAVKAESGRAAAPAAQPHRGRASQSAPAPHASDSTEAATPDAPAKPAAGVQQGRGLDNERRSPKP